MNANEYTKLIAGAHTDKEKFTRFVFELTEQLRIARLRLSAMVDDFDLEKAEGKQLDAIGVRVGVSRHIPMKLTGVYFALDNYEGVGLDFGVWKGQYDPDDGVASLGDETYRKVLKAKILANHFDGRSDSSQQYIRNVFKIFDIDESMYDREDAQTMQLKIRLERASVPPLVWELIRRRVIDFTPAGVEQMLEEHTFDGARVNGY